MPLCLSTHWNASQHAAGETLIEEILRLGFTRVELGYDLRMDLVPGVRQMVERRAVTVESVHNFCPVPVGAPFGHPEIFLLASTDRRIRDSAVLHTSNTIRFAAELGARAVVVHAGRVKMRDYTRRLLDLCEDGKQYGPRYERLRTKLLLKREKKAPKYLEALYRSAEELLPTLEKHKVVLAMENLPSWEALPSEIEMNAIMERFPSPWIAYWHDIGHGQVRQLLGLVTVSHWLGRYGPRLAGMHVHDVIAPAFDHLVPGRGSVPFDAFVPFLRPDLPLVLEPAPGTPAGEIQAGLRVLTAAWNLEKAALGT